MGRRMARKSRWDHWLACRKNAIAMHLQTAKAIVALSIAERPSNDADAAVLIAVVAMELARDRLAGDQRSKASKIEDEIAQAVWLADRPACIKAAGLHVEDLRWMGEDSPRLVRLVPSASTRRAMRNRGLLRRRRSANDDVRLDSIVEGAKFLARSRAGGHR